MITTRYAVMDPLSLAMSLWKFQPLFFQYCYYLDHADGAYMIAIATQEPSYHLNWNVMVVVKWGIGKRCIVPDPSCMNGYSYNYQEVHVSNEQCNIQLQEVLSLPICLAMSTYARPTFAIHVPDVCMVVLLHQLLFFVDSIIRLKRT